ncbi:TOMM system kinase/cyclase fusion protein [Sorangium sp. So ce1036]|uniref:TOMM system kinase/cyclase fusion protein n=1 Tax=Sorangium sp. So ce1036 TaxID=3133328 RepID=UPI003F11B9D5
MSINAVAPGAVFQGRYEVLSVLRQGGFAVVYKGRQLATGQPVAIKVLHQVRGCSPADAARYDARFRREMGFCARLHHPNIVRLLDSGQTDEGQLYAVFEFVPGKNLAELLSDEGVLDPQETRYLMLQVLDALSCAHAQGVVHRDLKPANVMVVPTGARRNALVLDFGIGAVVAGAHEGHEVKLTASNELLCTPAYAAPEQLRGLPLTARSDLYSWGLVFIECLTGKPAVSGRSLEEVFLSQVSPEPIPVPRALFGHPLGAILRRSTAKDVAARVVTADGLLRDLEACDVSGLSRADLAEPGVPLGRERADVGSGGGLAPGPRTFGATPQAELDRPQVGASFRVGTTEAAPSPSSGVLPSPAAVRVPEPGAQVDAEAAGLVEGERRPLTAVCCALSAGGPGLAAIDVEELDELFSEAQEICAEIARRHGGTFAGALGDQLLLHFGYPAAQEDDARHAARAALEIAAAIRARSARLKAERGATLEVRVGVHTGIVVAREGQRFVQHLGSTPQLAARLCALAPAGVVAASGDTYRILRSQFACDETGVQVPRHGASRPVRVYHVREELPPMAADRGGPEHDTAPLFGRDQEVDLLLQRWGQSRQGTGQIVLVTGGAGVGKSRLALELIRRLRREAHTCLECHCLGDLRHSALHPIIDMLDRLLEPHRGDAPGSRLDRLEALLARRGFPLSSAVPLLAALLSVPLEGRYALPSASPQRQKEMTLNLLLSLLFEMAEDQPVLFLVEDAQWADPTTLEWLCSLVAEVPSARMMALFTARPEFSPPWPTSGMLQIQLGRLDRSYIEQIAAQITGGRALPEPVLTQVVDRTDGVPLFVEELIRMVLDSGALHEEEGRYVLSGSLSELAIPTTLRGLLMARLDHLGRAKTTAQLAAALGREFRHDVLCAVSTLDEAALQKDVERLISADLIHRKRRAMNPTYMFKHALIRDAAYEALPRRTRQRVHARIARTLEERFAEIVETRPDLLARHHAAAEQKRLAIPYAERAAELALKRPASSTDDIEVVEHITHALGWLASIEDARERAITEMRLNNLLILALLDRRGYMAPELTAAVQRCEELSEQLGDCPLTSATLWAMVMYHNVRNHRREARALAGRLVGVAERSQDVGQLVWSLPLLGECLYTEGRFTEARKAHERCLALYDPARHREHAFAYGLDSRVYAQTSLSMVLCLMGYPDQAFALGHTAVAWARELDHPHSLARALMCLSGIYHYCRRREMVAEVANALIDVAERYRLWLKHFCWAMRRWAEGDVEELSRQIDVIRDSGDLSWMTYWPSLVAELEAERGDHEAAIARLDGCLKLAEETGERYYVPELYRLKALSILARDPRAAPETEACLRRAIALTREQGARLLELRSTLALCRLLLDQDRRPEGRLLLHEIGSWPAEHAEIPEIDEARALLREIAA